MWPMIDGAGQHQYATVELVASQLATCSRLPTRLVDGRREAAVCSRAASSHPTLALQVGLPAAGLPISV